MPNFPSCSWPGWLGDSKETVTGTLGSEVIFSRMRGAAAEPGREAAGLAFVFLEGCAVERFKADALLEVDFHFRFVICFVFACDGESFLELAPGQLNVAGFDQLV